MAHDGEKTNPLTGGALPEYRWKGKSLGKHLQTCKSSKNIDNPRVNETQDQDPLTDTN